MYRFQKVVINIVEDNVSRKFRLKNIKEIKNCLTK